MLTVRLMAPRLFVPLEIVSCLRIDDYRRAQNIAQSRGVPICISPPKNVPVQMTTWEQLMTSPVSRTLFIRQKGDIASRKTNLVLHQ